jgi:hypothetical protein
MPPRVQPGPPHGDPRARHRLGSAYAWTRGFDEGLVLLRTRAATSPSRWRASSAESCMACGHRGFRHGHRRVQPFGPSARASAAALVIAREAGQPGSWTAYALGRASVRCPRVPSAGPRGRASAPACTPRTLPSTRQLGGAIWISRLRSANLGHDFLPAAELDAAARWLEQGRATERAECAQKAIFHAARPGRSRAGARARLQAGARHRGCSVRAAGPGYRILLHDRRAHRGCGVGDSMAGMRRPNASMQRGHRRGGA